MPRLTVCQLHDDPQGFERDWTALVRHVQSEKSDLVLLPEVPFAPWIFTTRNFSEAAWNAASRAHDFWQTRLNELKPAVVLSTRPMTDEAGRWNEGFVWNGAYQAAHRKVYLPDEDGFWEASWYRAGMPEFTPSKAGEVSVGFAICSELWFMNAARAYGQAGTHLLVTPRCTEAASVDKWLIGGQAAAFIAGAYSASSNRFSEDGSYGGGGWVVNPDGDVLGRTTESQPFITVEIDLAEAENAKSTYPRYIAD
jgi:N-carbamoylputrescine amidase